MNISIFCNFCSKDKNIRFCYFLLVGPLDCIFQKRQLDIRIYNLDMQEGKQYFILDQGNTFKGECKQFISQSQKQWRTIDKLEQYPFERVSVYTRNIVYQPSNTRTFETLKKVLAYLIDKIFPMMLDEKKSIREREKIVLFLQERLIAIRCEYFVQGIICPKEILKLLRCFIVVWIIRGIKFGKNFQLIGLQSLIQPESKQIMQIEFPNEYLEALKFSILTIKKSQLSKLVTIHDLILDDQQLLRLLQLRLKIEQNLYEVFYEALVNEKTIIKCLIWLRIQEMKEVFLRIIKKSFGNVKSQWLFSRLCLQDKKQNEWQNVKQIGDQINGVDKDFQKWIQLKSFCQILL